VRGTLLSTNWESKNPQLYAPARYRKACRYEAFLPDRIAGLQIQLPGSVSGVVSDAEMAVAELNNRARPALVPFARLLLRTESIASSKVEGLQVDARSLARAEASGEGQRAGSQVQEILANIDAMELAIERAGKAELVTTRDLVAVHEILMRRSRPDLAGQIRIVQNWIGGNDYNPCGADFVPPPPEDVSGLLEDLCIFCNQDDLPPVVQAAIAHAQFETIHPFEDGNGRTGRALVHIILRRRGIANAYVPPISVVLAANKDSYIDGLRQFLDDDVSDWVEAFAAATARAAQLAARYLDQVSELQESWRQTLGARVRLRSDAAAWAVIDELPGSPVITIALAVAATKRSKSQVGIAFDQLEDAGVLVPTSTGRRNRSWEAAGFLDLLMGLDAG
jgi:Fic family protein